MSQIKVAAHAGFCFGVQRAIDMAKQAAAANAEQTTFTLGPLIHNPQVVAQLHEEGIEAVDHPEQARGGIVIIRSHGVSPQQLQQIENNQCRIVDATCPFVAKTHKFARFLQNEDYFVIIIGEPSHPEVQGIMGYAGPNSLVVSSPVEAQSVKQHPKIGVIAQTTQNLENFQSILTILSTRCEELRVFNTICSATRIRQESAQKLAQESDLMIVIGGKNSANTNRLARLSQATHTPTYHIETPDELRSEWFINVQKIGISAGASTPQWMIEKVVAEIDGILAN